MTTAAWQSKVASAIAAAVQIYFNKTNGCTALNKQAALRTTCCHIPC